MMEITFPGGVAVEARFNGHVVRTDQPAAAGGADSAPPPFDLFLASLATCTGYYAVAFCRRRDLPTDGLRLNLTPERNPETRRLDRIRMELTLPAGFPDKYREAILRSAGQCAIKRVMDDPPQVLLEAREG